MCFISPASLHVSVHISYHPSSWWGRIRWVKCLPHYNSTKKNMVCVLRKKKYLKFALLKLFAQTWMRQNMSQQPTHKLHIQIPQIGYVGLIYLRPPFLRFTKFKFRFADLPFSVFFRFLSKTVQTDQNLPFFWISKLKFENLGNFLQCSRNTSPGVNKQNGRSANISSHWRAEKGIQTAKVWPQKANKATFWWKSR